MPFSSVDALPEATAEEITAYYRENIARFTVPERRRFRYAIIDRTDIAETISVSDAEIAAFYGESDDLYGAAETRTVQQAVAQSQAEAAELVQRVRSGETLAAAAASVLDLSPEDLDLGALTRNGLTEAVNAELASAVFAAEEGEVVGPVRTSFGWHVARPTEVNSSPARPLAEVREEIAERLRTRKAADRVADLIGEAEDAFADGASLSEVAADLDLELVEPPPPHPDGSIHGRRRLRLSRGTAVNPDDGVRISAGRGCHRRRDRRGSLRAHRYGRDFGARARPSGRHSRAGRRADARTASDRGGRG